MLLTCTKKEIYVFLLRTGDMSESDFSTIPGELPLFSFCPRQTGQMCGKGP